MKSKTITTERYEICTLCGGRGQENRFGDLGMTTTGAVVSTCRNCGGSGRKLAEVTVTTETVE